MSFLIHFVQHEEKNNSKTYAVERPAFHPKDCSVQFPIDYPRVFLDLKNRVLEVEYILQFFFFSLKNLYGLPI